MVAPAARHPTSLCLSKLGDARFLGHLDFIRLVERSLRRADLPVTYTEGFNPRIKLVFQDAMPLGLASEGEWVNLTIQEDLSPEVIRERLESALPPAVELVEVRRSAAPPAQDHVGYHLELIEGVESVTDALSELLARDSCPVEDPRRGTLLDVRPFLVSGEINGDGLLLELVAVDGRPPRPGPIVQALCQLARDLGRPEPRFGTATRLSDLARRRGDHTWHDAIATVAAATAVPGGASSSSTPASPKRAGSQF